MDSQYNPKETEDKIYKLWEESGFFNPDNLEGTSNGNFTTCIAPPNITGELHMGHALEHTLWDIIVRMKRMQGYKVLWVPGIDHAGIAAQNIVEKQLIQEGTSRRELSKEKFLERMWEWKEKYGYAILDQFRKLGLSLDWSRLRFTLDPEYQMAVEHAFNHYYEKGWVYKGKRVINWCVRCATAVSDLEVNHVSETGKLYYLKYGPFIVATTRPETRLGDTGLAVNPSDDRYKNYVGQELEVETVDSSIPIDHPLISKIVKIKVVADHGVEKEFGTGVVKVTPAHDMLDSDIGKRNNLDIAQVIDEHGRMNSNAGKRYEGMKTKEAREQIVKDMKSLGLIEKIENYEHNVSKCDRCNFIIEPLPSEQWFLKMSELAPKTIQAIESGAVRIHPNRWQKVALDWLHNIRDWNISRQLWWGHKIPVEGEEDVLDTWFSSALWPMAVLGWPSNAKVSKDKTQQNDFLNYYPTQFITSARDILYLWILRMIFSGLEFAGEVPFRDVYIHATVLTKEGKRMSKSLGTGINPLDIMEKYGTDALRFGLASQATGLQDLKFGEDLMIMGKKFANKLWNIARYVTLKVGDDHEWILVESLQGLDSIATAMKAKSVDVTKEIEQYAFADAAGSLYDFVWHEFADKYIEETKDKDDPKTKNTLIYLLVNSLKLLHPFMPFITEEIYAKIPLKDKKLLMIENWPS